MRTYNYRSEALRLLDFESVNSIGYAYGFKERYALAKSHIPCMLEEMAKISLIHEIMTGLNIENRMISKDRVIELVLSNSLANNYEERLVVGYQKAFKAIYNGELENDDVYAASKRLHKLLYSQMPGKQNLWRTSNEPMHRGAEAHLLKHQPIPAEDAPESFKQICDECQGILSDKIINVLYIIPVFIIDTVYIQPFEKEAVLLVRLLVLHILHNAGFPIFEYTCMGVVPHEYIVKLYSTIGKGLLHWEQEANDYKPVFDYWMDVIQKSCSLFNSWASSMKENTIIKQKLIEKYIKVIDGKVTKQMIRDFSIGISDNTISLALSNLLKAGVIEKLHQGRSTAYRYIGEI